MSETSTRKIPNAVVLPLGVLILAAVLSWAGDAIAGKNWVVLDWIPVLVAGFGMAIATRNGRARGMLILFAVIVGSRLLGAFDHTTGISMPVFLSVVYAGYGVLMPLIVTIWAFQGEAGVFTIRGMTRFGVALGLVLAIAFIAIEGGHEFPSSESARILQEGASALFSMKLLPLDTSWTLLPQLALLSFAVCIPILIVRAIMAGRALAQWYGIALTSLAAALHFGGQGWLTFPFLLFAAAGLTYAVSVDLPPTVFDLDPDSTIPPPRV